MSLEIEFSFRGQTFNDAAKGLLEFHTALERDWDGAARVLSRELKNYLDSVAETLRQRHSGAWPGGTTANTLSMRSGALVNSIVASVHVSGETFTTVQGTIGSDVPYAKIQEEGGTISARNVTYLTIPLKAALNADGTPIHDRARDWPNTFVARSKAGNLIIFQKTLGKIVPLYVLRTSVVIPARLGLRTTLESGVPYFVGRAADAIMAAARGAHA